MIALIAVMSFGIQIGNVRIGNQNDTLGITQKSEIDQSNFSKKFLESDKVIFLNLWATWCEPCIAENRTAIVNYLQNKPADNSLNSLSIPMTYLIKNKKVVKVFDGSLESKAEVVDAINSVL